MKATLTININDEPFQETELNLETLPRYENLSPALIAHRLEEVTTLNEKKVRQAIARSINDNPLIYAHAVNWEAWLRVPSSM